MSINTISSPMTIMAERFRTMRNDLVKLQEQLGTGRRADTYGGLGAERDLTIGFRAEKALTSGYRETIRDVNIRLDVMQTALTRLDEISLEAKSAFQPTPFQLIDGKQTAEQKTAREQLEEIASLLNSEVNGRYLFSGQTTDTKPVLTVDTIVEGDGTRAGLRQVIAERRQADLGADGRGRLSLASGPGAGMTIQEDVAGHPFGFKVSAITSDSGVVTTTGPAGAQNTVTASFTGVPAVGDRVRLTLDLPDGTTETIELTASNAATPGAGEFKIGTDAATTAANFETAMTAAIETLAATDLAAASAYQAGEDFFAIDDANPPQRVAGPPFDTATGFVAGTAADTVFWYQGEGGSGDARNTAIARIDDDATVAYGARANEIGLRTAFQNLAVMAVAEFSPSDPNAAGEFGALAERLRPLMHDPDGSSSPRRVSVDLAAAQTAMERADERHIHTEGLMGELIDDNERVDPEEVAMKLLTVQTRLEATYQVTSMLSQLSLTRYL